MAKISKIEKFLTALFDAGGEIARSELAVRVFRRNWSAAQLDALVSAPELRGLVTVTRAPRRAKNGKGHQKDRRGRPSMLYRLTGSGWALLRAGLRNGVQPHRIDSAECARQFALLVGDRDPWASEMARQAAVGREHEAREQRKQEEARAARQKEIDALPRHPSAGRKRSAKELEQRAAWAASKGFGPLVQESEVEPVSVAPDPPRPLIAPAIPAPIPQAPIAPRAPFSAEQQAAKDFREALGLSARYYGPSSAMPKDCEPIQPRLIDAKELAKQAALLKKIAAAGFQVRDGKVLYGGAWISPEAWQAKMPNALD